MFIDWLLRIKQRNVIAQRADDFRIGGYSLTARLEANSDGVPGDMS